jgi:hypothetical protein
MAVSRLVAISLLATGLVTLGACESEQSPASTDAAPGGKEFDWEQGRFEGVRLGDGTARVVRVIGRPARRGPKQPFEPFGEDFYDIGGMTSFRTPNVGGVGDYEALRYRRLVVAVIGRKVIAWGTTDPRAQTPEGVGVGDSQELVEQRYPSARCFVQNEGTEYTTYPFCKARVCKGRLLGFGGDPIRSLWLAAETRAGLGSCRRS